MRKVYNVYKEEMLMEQTMQLKDILYFDFEKASSIWSQLQWGKLESYEVKSEDGATKGAEVKAGIPSIIDAKLNISGSEKRTILETRILHHDLLSRIEAMLNDAKLLIDINDEISQEKTSPDEIRSIVEKSPYIIAAGWSAIEDYRRILAIMGRFNEIADFISSSSVDNIKKSPEYLQLLETIKNEEGKIKDIKDQRAKSLAKAKLQSMRKNIDEMIRPKGLGVDDKTIKGITNWITTFLPNRINFRLYPFVNCPSFQILCNLKRESFVDQDLEHLLYGYSTRPNIQLGIFGLITSLPPKNGENFDLLSEFAENDDMTKEMHFEKAMREMFKSMDGLENFVRYSRYPNITVHPIAVFRPFPGNESKDDERAKSTKTATV